MADSSSYSNVSVEQLTANFSSGLKGWRELVVSSRDVFLWKQSHHNGLIAGFVTAIFALIWLLDATLLTTISIIGIILTVADYAVPLVCANFFDPANWNDKKEKEFNQTCAALAETWKSVLDLWGQWIEIKTTRPRLYSGLLLGILIVLAWIGNLFNNLFLTYLIVLFLALYPGLKTHGIIEMYLGKLITTIKENVGEKMKKKD